jgi:DNA-binding SARP family transcriptional activator
MIAARNNTFVPEYNIGTHPREKEHHAFYRVYFFGAFRLFYQAESIGEKVWRRNKAKSILKWFLLNSGKLCSADQLIDTFWSDVSPDTALGNLHVTMHYLRHLLEPSLGPRQNSKYIRHQANNFYWFSLDESWWSDIYDVQHSFDMAHEFDQSQNHAKASFYYRKIASYGHVKFLPDNTYEEWLKPYYQYYEHIYAHSLVRLIHFYKMCNEPDEILEYAYQALALDPCCEPAALAIVDVYRQQGNTSLANHKFNAFRASMHGKFGAEHMHRFADLRQDLHA